MQNKLSSALKTEERKVEYVELIYDLIFVYLVSRNGSLLEEVEGGFLTLSNFLTYLASTLIVLQVWYLSVLYINQYGTGSVREHLMLFINMYLLYYMADGIRSDWGVVYLRYNGAWAMILLNMAFQFFYTGRMCPRNSDSCRHPRRHALVLLIEAVIVFATIPIYYSTGIALAPWGLVFGVVALGLTWKVDQVQRVDFAHLSERVMLYIVFTFGEMILAITGYFDDDFNLVTAYFSLMAFAIIVGLFSSYGYYYDHLKNEEVSTSGIGYLLLHIPMILALNNITAAMHLMQNPHVLYVPKTLFLVISQLMFFLCLMGTQKYARVRASSHRKVLLPFVLSAIVYLVAALGCSRYPMVNIFLSVAFIYFQLFLLRFGKKTAVSD